MKAIECFRCQAIKNKIKNHSVDKKAGTKVGPDQLGLPIRVGSTRIDSDHEKNSKLNEIETFTYLKVKIPVINGPN